MAYEEKCELTKTRARHPLRGAVAPAWRYFIATDFAPACPADGTDSGSATVK